MKKVLFIILAATLLFIYPTVYYSSSETIVITVKEKDRITTGSSQDLDSKFVIYSNNEVLENTDSWLFLKFNSADLQNEIQPKTQYQAKVVGWRIPFLSSYRNVIEVTKVTS